MRHFWGICLLISLSAFAASGVTNYTSQVISFGPQGEPIDLQIRFRKDFVTALEKKTKQATAIVWISEGGFCLDSEPDCAVQAKKGPFCRLQIEHLNSLQKDLLDSTRAYGPFKNLEYEITTKPINGDVLILGKYAYNWAFTDFPSGSKVALECSPGAGRNSVEFTKNLFTRVTGDAFDTTFVVVDDSAKPAGNKDESPVKQLTAVPKKAAEHK